MTVFEHVAAGRLRDALANLKIEVRTNPADPDRRYLLFGLLAFAGAWRQAEQQLDAMEVAEPGLGMAARVCRHLLASEGERIQAYSGHARPVLPSDAPEHACLRAAALEAYGSGDVKLGSERLEQAVDRQPVLAGTLNESPFSGLRDDDDLLGSALEVYAGGRYLWLPWERIVRLSMGPAGQLLDLIWRPAQIVDVGGKEFLVHLPMLYCGSASSSEDVVRMGRKTEWVTDSDGIVRGYGQRMLAWTDQQGCRTEIPLQDLRTLEFERVE
jgi:type VI secretion system protein ImpE